MCLLKTGKQLGQVSPCPSSLPDKYPVSRLLKHLDEILATHRSLTNRLLLQSFLPPLLAKLKMMAQVLYLLLNLMRLGL